MMHDACLFYISLRMVRNYKRKTQDAYSKESLTAAVNAVKRGEIDARKASSIYSIPITTIKDHVSGRRGTKSTTLGRPTFIPPKYEERLANCLRTMEKWGMGLTQVEIQGIVMEWVQTNGVPTGFKNEAPGEDWLVNFRKRHKLSLKKPQAVELARKRSQDPFIIHQFYDLLERVLNEHSLGENPGRIWNIDETSFCLDPSKLKVVGAKGLPSTRTVSGSGKTNISVCLGGSAAGEKLPPLIIFKGANMWDKWMSPEAFPGEPLPLQ
ncbi:hypothetical protein GE061_006031 [Apolygus lucorum]|uniref:HTH psq-type domain-containing protein n=1 Tax=Apolygus lucorum TaxID=248454 RepID=A0A8S9WSU7_APOLU|nr:hypothetical protein GE061_006031 [Apolygus lucorum]